MTWHSSPLGNRHGFVRLPCPAASFHIRFRWDKRYKRSLKPPDHRAAHRRCEVIEELIQDLKLGKREIDNGEVPISYDSGCALIHPITTILVNQIVLFSDNIPMETAMQIIEPAIDQAQADLEEVCRLLSEGKRVTDTELARRITEHADEARAEALRLLGVQDGVVEIIREMRDLR